MKAFLTALTCLVSIHALANSPEFPTIESLKQKKPFTLGLTIEMQQAKKKPDTMTTKLFESTRDRLGEADLLQLTQSPGKILNENQRGCVLEKKGESASGNLEVRTLKNGGRDLQIRLVEHKKGEQAARGSIPLVNVSADIYEDVFEIQTANDTNPVTLNLICRNICVTTKLNYETKKPTQNKCEQYLPTATSNILQLLQSPNGTIEVPSNLDASLYGIPKTLVENRNLNLRVPSVPLSSGGTSKVGGGTF